MSSAFSKSSVFVCKHIHAKTAFSKSSTLESVFRKVPFSLIVFIGYVRTEAVSVKKKLRFHIKTDTCEQGLSQSS